MGKGKKKKEIFGFGIKTEFQFCCVSLDKSVTLTEQLDFPGGSDGKEPACNATDLGLSPGSGRCPGERNGNPLQYSCLKNPMDRGSWWATVLRIAKSQTRLKQHNTTHTLIDCTNWVGIWLKSFKTF